MAASCSGFRTMSLLFSERSFNVSWTENSNTPSNASSDDYIYVDLVVFRMSDYALKTNFWCHILINQRITNQTALLLLVHGQMEFGKMFGIDCRWFFFSPLPPPSHSPPPSFSPIFCSLQACSFTRPLFRSLVRSPPGKGKEMAAT